MGVICIRKYGIFKWNKIFNKMTLYKLNQFCCEQTDYIYAYITIKLTISSEERNQAINQCFIKGKTTEKARLKNNIQ